MFRDNMTRSMSREPLGKSCHVMIMDSFRFIRFFARPVVMNDRYYFISQVYMERLNAKIRISYRGIHRYITAVISKW